MVTLRYHISTMITVFVALGLGMVIGGTIGQGVVQDAQAQVLQLLHIRYKELVAEHQLLQGELHSYHELTRQLAPEMNGRRIVWQGRHDPQSEHLIQRLRELGAIVTIEEEHSPSMTRYPEADLLLLAHAAQADPLASAITMDNAREAGIQRGIPVLDMRAHLQHGSIPENTAHLIKLVQETLTGKEAPHAASVSRYSSLE